MADWVCSKLVVLLPIVGASFALETAECNCGYGGICLSRWPIEQPSCNFCPLVSLGFYEDCSIIKNHCEFNPCDNWGTCIESWGSFICKCEEGYFGHQCQYSSPTEEKILSELGILSYAIVYYQVQPRPDGTNKFTIIYNPGDEEELLKHNLRIDVNIYVGDGSVFFPKRKHFKKESIKMRCLDEAMVNPALYDKRICNYIPAGEFWVYDVDITHQEGFHYLSKLTGITDSRGADIGVGGILHLRIFLKNLKNNKEFRLFDRVFTIFEYTSYRILHNCKADIVFNGCSVNKFFPKLLSRGHELNLSPIFRRHPSCRGTLKVRTQWFYQRNVGRDDNFPFDEIPVLVGDDKNIQFPPRTFDPGLHAFYYHVVRRGNSPHFGGTAEFEIRGRCWVNVTIDEPFLTELKGTERYVQCQKEMVFQLLFHNPAYDLQDFTFYMKCDVTGDPNCEERRIDPTGCWRRFKECGQTYNVTFLAFGRKGFPNTTTNVIIHSQNTNTDLLIICISNCIPIDPNYRTLFRAQLTPYSENPVKWSTTVGDSSWTDLDGYFNLFDDHVSSRLYKANGNRFVQNGIYTSEVKVEATYNARRPLLSGYKSISLNTQLVADSFTLITYPNGTFKFISNMNLAVIGLPLRFRSYCIFNTSKLFFVLMDTTHVEELLFEYSCDSAILCVQNAFFIDACTTPHIHDQKRPHSQSISLSSLAVVLNSGDIYKFITQSIAFINRTLYTDGKIMRWDEPPSVKKQLLLYMRELQLVEQHDMMVIISFVSFYFSSEAGSDYDGTPKFVGDEAATKDFSLIVDLLELKYIAIIVLRDLLHLFQEDSTQGYLKLRILKSPGGDSFDFIQPNLRYYRFGRIIARAWALCFLHEYPEFEVQPVQLHRRLVAEVEFWARFTFSEFKMLSDPIGSIFTNLIPPYSGLRAFGSRHVRIYFVVDTFTSIVHYVDKTNPKVENLPVYADYVFGDVREDEWQKPLQLDLPSINWQALQLFSLLVFAADTYVTNDFSSPLVIVELRKTVENELVNTLPEGNMYALYMPTTLLPILYPNREEVIFQPAVKNEKTPWRYLVAFKVTLPVVFHDFFNVVVDQFNYVEGSQEWNLKANVSVGYQIEYQDVVNAKLRTGDYSMNVSRKLARSTITRLNVSDGSFPSEYYVGILLDDTRAQKDKNDNVLRFDIAIRCMCSLFGTVYSVVNPVKYTQLFYEPITLVLPAVSEAPVVIICTVLILCALLLLLIAFLFDIRRVKVEQIHFVEDAFPGDKLLLLIGIYTGMNLFAGSVAHVAIKIVGTSSSSRVHILRTRRKKALQWLRDDWFVIPVSQPLGVIVNICLWHDFHLSSDWYCSRVIIFDNVSFKWYFIDVERWFMLYDDDEESRLALLLAEEMDELGVAMDRHEQSYSNYFIKELQNTHSPLSVFFMHPRYIAFYEQKCLIFLVKMFGLFFSSWLLLEHGFKTVFINYNSDPLWLTRISRQTFQMIVTVALFSHLFTFPCSYIYRWYVRSRAVQLRTTNPIVRHLSRTSRSYSISQTSQITEDGAGRSDRKSRKSISWQPASRSASKVMPDRGRHISTDRGRHFSTDKGRKISTDRGRHVSTDRISRSSSRSRSRLFSRKSLNPFSLRADRPGFWSYFVGPCQLKSVDVPMTFFTTRMNHQIGARFCIGSLLLFLIGFFVYTEIFTEHWRLWKQSIFFVLTGLLLDVIVLEPVLIFIKSFLAYSVFNLSNAEKNLLDQEIKLDGLKLAPLTFAQYLKKVTRKRYKPFTSEQLANKHSQQFIFRVVIFSLLHLCVFVVLICSYYQVSWIHTQSNWAMVRSVYERYFERHERGSLQLNEILRSKDLITYVVNNYIDWNWAWPSGLKNVSNNGMSWGVDYYSKPVGALNIIAQVVTRQGNRTINEMGPFVQALEPYSWNNVLCKDPIQVGFKEIKFRPATVNGHLRGNSKQYYYFEGHAWHIGLHSWVALYSDLRFDLLDVFDGDWSRNFKLNVFIFTTNVVCPYLSGMLTVDLLFEAMPSGIRSAKVELRLMQIFDPRYDEQYPGRLFRIISSFFTLLILIFNICIMCKVGIVQYFTSYRSLLLAAYVLVVFLNSLSSAFFYPQKFVGWEEVVDNPTDVYTELHDVSTYSLVDNAIVCILFCVTAVEAALVVQWIFKMEIMKSIQNIVFRMTLVVMMMAVALIDMFSLLVDPEPGMVSITIVGFLKEMFPLSKADMSHAGLFLIPSVVIVYIVKLSMGICMYRYLSVKGIDVRLPVSHPMKVKTILGYVKAHPIPHIRSSDDSRRRTTKSVSIKSSPSGGKASKEIDTTSQKQEKLDKKFIFF